MQMEVSVSDSGLVPNKNIDSKCLVCTVLIPPILPGDVDVCADPTQTGFADGG